jgi:arylsulfatase A-like enzyme
VDNKLKYFAFIFMILLLTCKSIVASAQPNIVFILVDDWGYGDASSKLSGVPLPGIDAIAKAGITFTNGYVTASVCAPSRTGAFLGFSSQRIGLYDNPPNLPADWPESFGLPVGVTTLAESLHQLGYATGMFGKWHMGKRPDQHPMQRGFDEFLGMIGSTHPYFGEMDGNPVMRGYTPEPQSGYLTDVFAQEAASFIHRHASQPFYIYFSPNAVHEPYEAKPEILATLAYIADPRRKLFAGALISLSQAVGTITAALQADGLYNNTLIVLIGDNGGVSAGKTKPLRGRKGSLYEGGIRVPFFAAWPNILPAGTTYSRPVSSLDLFPTFLNAAGGLPGARLEGVNLLPYLTSGLPQPDRYLYWAKTSNSAVRRGDWKLQGYGTYTQLYNLSTDISEKNNVAAANPLIVSDLSRARLAWTKTLAKNQ